MKPGIEIKTWPHNGGWISIAYLPDGKQIASATWDTSAGAQQELHQMLQDRFRPRFDPNKTYETQQAIAAAAVRVGERIFTGPTHFDAVAKIMQIPDLEPQEKVDMVLAGESGFITDDGRFVNREEAKTISQQAGIA